MTPNNLLQLSREHPLILASGSPRRVELLKAAGVAFTQQVSDIHERQNPGEAPEDYALRLAKEKALVVSARAKPPNAITLGCDTIVVLDGEVLEKPDSADHAFAMLSRLSGRTHRVISAVALAAKKTILGASFDVTSVTFHPLDPDDIRKYIASGEPMDKAGSYGIQGMGGFLVDSVVGDMDTVVGLPMRCLDKLAGDVRKRRE